MTERDERAVPHITLLVAFAAALCVMIYSFSGAPKGPLEEVLPGTTYHHQLAPTTDQFMADRAALEAKVQRRYHATHAVSAGPPS